MINQYRCAAASARAHFNPRPPCGRRRAIDVVRALDRDISTHVPRAGDDHFYGTAFQCLPISTHVPRAGDDRGKSCGRTHLFRISTHVPRAGDDPPLPPSPVPSKDFNPRPPCGRRRQEARSSALPELFQPTSPVRETTGSSGLITGPPPDFNPRPPCGRRL